MTLFGIYIFSTGVGSGSHVEGGRDGDRVVGHDDLDLADRVLGTVVDGVLELGVIRNAGRRYCQGVARER